MRTFLDGKVVLNCLHPPVENFLRGVPNKKGFAHCANPQSFTNPEVHNSIRQRGVFFLFLKDPAIARQVGFLIQYS